MKVARLCLAEAASPIRTVEFIIESEAFGQAISRPPISIQQHTFPKNEAAPTALTVFARSPLLPYSYYLAILKSSQKITSKKLLAFYKRLCYNKRNYYHF